MAFALTDIRIPLIKEYLNTVRLHATGVFQPLLPGQMRPHQDSLVAALVAELTQLSIAQDFALSVSYLTEAIRTAFVQRVVAALHTLSRPDNRLSVQTIALNVMNDIKALDLQASDDNRQIFAVSGANGETYQQKLRRGVAHGVMLDSEALNALLEAAHLPENVGHIEAVRQNGNSLSLHDLNTIQKALEGYTEADGVHVPAKKYIIASLSQNNAHWYGNLYQLVNGRAQPLYSVDYEYSQGNNTCGISAVAHSLRALQTLLPGYVSNLPAPNADATTLSTAANRLILSRDVALIPAVISPPVTAATSLPILPATLAPMSTPTAPAMIKAKVVAPSQPKKAIIPATDQVQAIAEQRRVLSQFFAKSKTPLLTPTQDKWHTVYSQYDAKTQQQYHADHQLALELAAEELNLYRIR